MGFFIKSTKQIFAKNFISSLSSRLSQTEKIVLSLINFALFFTGAFFGVICELLLKAISAGKREFFLRISVECPL